MKIEEEETPAPTLEMKLGDAIKEAADTSSVQKTVKSADSFMTLVLGLQTKWDRAYANVRQN